MYVSQLPATVLYTVLKTILLFLLSTTITSICAWMNRYDLAKIFEQGNITVLCGTLTSKQYNRYKGMFVCLLELIIGLLPTIATKYMPFENVIINNGTPKYFQAKFNIPEQNVSITSSNDNMDSYCQGMGLCDTNGYYGNIVNISDTIKVTQIEFNFENNQYITEFCNVSIDNYFESKTIIYNEYINVTKETNYDLTIFMANLKPKINYNNNLHYTSSFMYQNILPLLYYPDMFNFASISNRADLIYSDGNNHVLLIMKAAIYSYVKISDNEDYQALNKQIPEYNIFNNSQLYYNIAQKYKSSVGNYTRLFSKYTYNNFQISDYFQYSFNNFQEITITKGRLLFGVYVINDENFNVKEFTNDQKTIVNFNIILINELNNYINTSIFEDFNEPPTNDLFMYSILSNSNNSMYGIQGHREIVADISPIFICIIVGIIILLTIIYILTKYIKDKIYFQTFLQTIGISNLSKINKENEILLKDNEK